MSFASSAGGWTETLAKTSPRRRFGTPSGLCGAHDLVPSARPALRALTMLFVSYGQRPWALRLGPVAVWEAMQRHRLVLASIREFRARPEFSDLNAFTAEELIVSAALTMAEDLDGRLLLGAWREQLRRLPDVSFPTLEQVSDLLDRSELDEAAGAALAEADSGALRRELTEARDRREQQTAEAAARSQQEHAREERDRIASEAAEVERRAAKDEQNRRSASKKREQDEEERRYLAESDASERAARVRADRLNPPVHDTTYEPPPWEQWCHRPGSRN